MRDNFDDDERDQIRCNDKNRKKNQHLEIKDDRKQFHGCSIVGICNWYLE